jgi:UPF0755 protein
VSDTTLDTDAVHDELVDEDDGDYVYVPKENRALRKTMSVLVLLAILVVVVLGGAGFYVVNQIRGGSKSGDPITVTIPDGATFAQASDVLEEQGVIKSSTIFRYYAKWKNLDTIKAGDYDQMYRGESLDDTIARIEQGPLPQKFTSVTFPEGYWLKDINAKILNTFPEMTATDLQSAETFEAALGPPKYKYHPAGTSLEGFLFPATYRVEKADLADEGKLIDQMMSAFDVEGDKLGLDQASTKLAGVAGRTVITPYDVVIVASMVEREAKVPEDRAKIARVIYNRLARGMKLQVDATIMYCIGEHKDTLTQSDLNSNCPYNTRLNSGLPPTPIASPGEASLQAALNPEPGPWLYYVLADKDGHHFFTDDVNAFNKAVADAQKQGLL